MSSPLPPADQRRQYQSGGSADTELKSRQSGRRPAPVQLELSSVHGFGGVERAVGVIGLRFGGAKHGHHGIAHELHHGAMRLEKGVAGNGAVLHELASEAAWIRFL